MILFVPIISLLAFGEVLILLVAHGKVTTDAPATSAAPAAPRNKSKDEICESLKSGTSKGIPILVAGLLKNRLIVVTSAYQVYELKVTSLSKAVDKLYLNTNPVPLETKYPQLWNHHNFTRTRKRMYAAWTAMDHVSDYLCFETKVSLPPENGVNYDIKHKQVLNGWYYNRYEPEVQMISSSTKLRFYGISDMKGNGLAIEEYRFDGATVSTSSGFTTVVYFKALCFDGKAKSTIFMSSSTDSCPSGSTRYKRTPIPKGFVDKGKFYLFGEHDVHVFSEEVVTNKGSKHPIKYIKFGDFFLCQGDYIPPEFEDQTDLGLFLASLLIILLLMLLCCLFIGKRIYDNHKRNQESYHSTSVSGHSSGSPSVGSGHGSVRSGSTSHRSARRGSVGSVGAPSGRVSVRTSVSKSKSLSGASLRPSGQASIRSSGSRNSAKASGSPSGAATIRTGWSSRKSGHSAGGISNAPATMMKPSASSGSAGATIRTGLSGHGRSGTPSGAATIRTGWGSTSKKTSAHGSASSKQTRRSGLSNAKH